MKALVNFRSVVKQAVTGQFCGQVVLHRDNGDKDHYACKTKMGMIFDENDVYKFNAGSWEKVNLDTDTLTMIQKPFINFIRIAGTGFKRKMKDAKGRDCFGIWGDAVLYVSTKDGEGHLLKIGNKVFSTFDQKRLIAGDVKNDDVLYYSLDDLAAGLQVLNKDFDNTRLFERIKKQLQFAFETYEDKQSRKPIGFKNVQDMADYRHSTGQYTQSYKQYMKSR